MSAEDLALEFVDTSVLLYALIRTTNFQAVIAFDLTADEPGTQDLHTFSGGGRCHRRHGLR